MFQSFKTLPKTVEIKPLVDFDQSDLKEYKNHEGKNNLMTIQIPKKLEDSINRIISGKFQYFKLTNKLFLLNFDQIFH